MNDAITVNETSIIRLLFVASIFNSLIADYIIRNMVQIHVNKTYILRLPMPQPSDQAIMENDDYRLLVINAAKLTFYFGGEAFREIIDELGIDKSDIPASKKAVDYLKIENDLIVAKIYGLNKADLERILDNFKVLGEKYPEYVAALKSKSV
jgi:hypothetical protein